MDSLLYTNTWLTLSVFDDGVITVSVIGLRASSGKQNINRKSIPRQEQILHHGER